MGRKSLSRKRKAITTKVYKWLRELLINLQYENLESLTIDDMAKLAGKSKSTIYQYFESKEDILEAACQIKVNDISKSILVVTQQKLDTVKQYKQLVEVFAEGTSNISISFLQNIKLHYPNAWSVINEFTDHFVELLQEHYQKGMNEELYNPVSVELLGHIDKIFVSQVVSNPSIFSDKEYSIDDLIKDYLNLRLLGLLKR